MSIKELKQQEVKKNTSVSYVTEPLRYGARKNKLPQKAYSLKVYFDRAVFVGLGALAVWAFYSALASLILL